jgi:hypothetical protein
MQASVSAKKLACAAHLPARWADVQLRSSEEDDRAKYVEVTYTPKDGEAQTSLAGLTFLANEPVQVPLDLTIPVLLREEVKTVEGVVHTRSVERKVRAVDVLKTNPYFKVDGVPQKVQRALPTPSVRAVQEMDAGFRQGECWNNWIIQLSRIMEAEGLPRAVGKGSVDPEKISPFVRLVDKLQDCVPKAARRHTQSKGALAGAIYRARRDCKQSPRSRRTSPLNDHNHDIRVSMEAEPADAALESEIFLFGSKRIRRSQT